MPEEGIPIRTSPEIILSPVNWSPFGNHPKEVPDISNSLTISGSEAVSPPAKLTFAILAACDCVGGILSCLPVLCIAFVNFSLSTF